MVCYFCKKSTHVTEYCYDFPTLRSRYSEIWKRGESNCLCPKYEQKSEKSTICKCGKICTICFQHHHFLLCPKRDSNHPLNIILMPEPLLLFSHHSPFAKRFFEFCNPCDQFKLQKCCKYFKNLKSVSLKLQMFHHGDNRLLPQNMVLNDSKTFVHVNNLLERVNISKCYYTLKSIVFHNCRIKKEDLRFFSISDPHAVSFNYCRFRNLEFQDILEMFPYACEFQYTAALIEENWVIIFLCAERHVNLRKKTTNDYKMEFEIGYFINLFEQNENLLVNIISDKFPDPYFQHHRFLTCRSNENYNVCIDYGENIKKYYKYQA